MTTFRLATPEDDGVMRAMMRDNAMRTWVDMAVEREPSFFAGMNRFGCDWAVIAKEGDHVIGMYTASVLPAHLNGQAERIGYLGGLRVNAEHRRRIRYLRDGYASIRRLAPVSSTQPFWFTVIADENQAARRLLEAGVAGLPAYRSIGRTTGFAVATSRGRARGLWRRAMERDIDAIVLFHNERAASVHCSPVLNDERVRRIGLDAFLVHERDEAIRGVAALWDQRAYKQLVARGYRRPIGALVPAWNLAARFLLRVPLPPPGRALEQTFIACLALSNEALEHHEALFRDLLTHCRTPVASVTLHDAHALTGTLNALKPVCYPMTVYEVVFDGECALTLAAGSVQPEAAVL